MTGSELPPGLLLKGLDGSNPLGFLAALGTLRVVTDASPSSKWSLQWHMSDGAWTPELLGDNPLSEETLVDLLMPVLKQLQDQPALQFAKNLNVSCEQFRLVTEKAQTAATFTNRHEADFIAAFGCESLPISERNPTIQDTAPENHERSRSSTLSWLHVGTRANDRAGPHTDCAVFFRGSMQTKDPSMRWDPADDRRYALRWKDPSKDSIRTVRGANRLAIEALPLLPTAPGERRLHTTGFSQRPGEGVVFTWPIWDIPLSMDVVRSLLSMAELQEPEPDHATLRARGVVEVYRSQRITTGKFRNFTVASPA